MITGCPATVSLVSSQAGHVVVDRAIRQVYIDGHLMVDEGKVLTLDHAAALAALAEAQARIIAAVPQHDWAKRDTADAAQPADDARLELTRLELARLELTLRLPPGNRCVQALTLAAIAGYAMQPVLLRGLNIRSYSHQTMAGQQT